MFVAQIDHIRFKDIGLWVKGRSSVERRALTIGGRELLVRGLENSGLEAY